MKGKTSIFYLALACTFIINGCKIRNNNEIALARVHNTFLYPSDIVNLLPEDYSQNDSIIIVNNYIDNWIKTQLILQKAEINLDDESKNVEKQIQNYRNSLIIYRYKQKLLTEKLDTTISDDEISQYYNDYQRNFILQSPVVKGLYIRTPLMTPNMNDMKRLYRSQRESDIEQLDKLGQQFAETYIIFEDWMPLKDITNQIPVKIENEERFLRYTPYIDEADSIYQHLVNIKEYKLAGETAPISFVEDDIKNIIINKRKVKFARDLEKNIYNDAQNKGHFEIFKRQEP